MNAAAETAERHTREHEGCSLLQGSENVRASKAKRLLEEFKEIQEEVKAVTLFPLPVGGLQAAHCKEGSKLVSNEACDQGFKRYETSHLSSSQS